MYGKDLWLEWKDDEDSMWAEVYGVCPKHGTVYAGDTLIVFQRAFGVWYSGETKHEFKNTKSMRKWVEELFVACGRLPNEFRNRKAYWEREMKGENYDC